MELEESDTYKYLGQEESVGYDGPINKQRISQEYLKRVKKIWNSQLSAINKSTADNVFAVPIMTLVTGILDWTRKEIEDLDIRSRKIMAMSASLHVRSDVERLYAKRAQCGRGLISLSDIYTSLTVSLAAHINCKKDTNELLNKLYEHEQNNLVRVASELKQSLNIEDKETTTKQLSQKVKNQLKQDHFNNWQKKVTHRYNQKSIGENLDVDQALSIAWFRKPSLRSHMEGYLSVVDEQEIVTKATAKCRGKDPTI